MRCTINACLNFFQHLDEYIGGFTAWAMHDHPRIIHLGKRFDLLLDLGGIFQNKGCGYLFDAVIEPECAVQGDRLGIAKSLREVAHNRNIAACKTIDGLPVIPDTEEAVIDILIPKRLDQPGAADGYILELIHQDAVVGGVIFACLDFILSLHTDVLPSEIRQPLQ